MKKLNPRTIALILGVLLVIATGLGAQYATKVYIEQGGAKQVVASGGEIEVQSGGTLDVQSGATLNLLGSSFDPSSYALTSALADYVPVTKAGQQTITATGSGNDVTITADDAITLVGNVGVTGRIAVAGPSGGVNGAESSILVYDASLAETSVRWTAGTAGTGGTVAITADDAAVVTFGAGSSTFTGLARLTPSSAPPVACAAGAEGGLYLDIDTHLLCVCNATAWVQVADGTTGCS